jgi:hypothetical protein
MTGVKMQRVIKEEGFVLEGTDKLFKSELDAQAQSVYNARFAMIKEGISHKWYSDPVGELLKNEKLLKAVAELNYDQYGTKVNG